MIHEMKHILWEFCLGRMHPSMRIMACRSWVLISMSSSCGDPWLVAVITSMCGYPNYLIICHPVFVGISTCDLHIRYAWYTHITHEYFHHYVPKKQAEYIFHCLIILYYYHILHSFVHMHFLYCFLSACYIHSFIWSQSPHYLGIVFLFGFWPLGLWHPRYGSCDRSTQGGESASRGSLLLEAC